MSTIVFSDQSVIFSLSCSGLHNPQDMVKMKKTTRLQGAPMQPVSAAVKDPIKTSTFLNTIDAALEKFDDAISSVTADDWQAAYHNLTTAYHKALGTI